MKSVSGKEVAKALERNGWSLLRVQGSRHIYGKIGSEVRLSVPFTAIRHSRRDCFGI